MASFGRDPVAQLPFLHGKWGSPRPPSGWLLGRSFFDLPPVLRANLTISLLRSLARGFLTGLWRNLPPVGDPTSWASAGALAQDLALRVLEAHRQL